jgi:alpha-tubulin suppressor-like RCC1 family protein
VKTGIARRVLVTFAVAAVTGPVAVQAAVAASTAGAAAGDARPQAAAALRQGPLMAWGYNGLGALGIGTTENQDLPVAVNVPRGLRANQARTGPFSVAVNAAGQAYTWGEGEQGELGNGAFKSHLRPVQVRLPKGVKVTAARGGYQFAVALTTTGKVLTWGNGTSGQLGNGHKVNRDAPVWVKLPRGVRITAVSACGECAIALTSTGRVLAWGDGDVGQLGDGKKASTDTPVWVKLPRHTKVTAIAAGADHLLAVTSTGGLLAWGDNSRGELGIGAKGTRLTAVRVKLPRGVKVASASAGLLHSLALTTTGRVLAWGGNTDGQLGDGSTTGSSIPVWVHLPKIAHIISVAAGRYHSLALTRGGKVLAWGDGSYGQLGDGSMSDKLLPVQISVPGTVIAIGAGDDAEASMAVVTKIID